jgi:cysteine desulfurase
MAEDRIYLDHAATTPVDPRGLEAMIPYFSQRFGNPSSTHHWGQQADAAVEASRETVAKIFGCSAGEIIFTSCGSESDNLALRGAAYTARESRAATHILTTPVEHEAVLHTALDLAEHHGFDLEFLPVDTNGRVNPDDLAKSIRPETAVVSVIYANNEIGTINPIPELGAICSERGVPLHTDAVQAAGQMPIKVDDLSIDMMSISAHKFYGPKGIGALYLRSGTKLMPTQTGGSQEFNLRAGTLNTPLIVGLAKALSIVMDEHEEHYQDARAQRDRLISAILSLIPDARLTGDPTHRLPNHASFVLRGVDSNQLLAALDLAGFGCASGSACKTGDTAPSQVLTAIGLPPAWALGSLRVTVGRSTTHKDIESFLNTLPSLVERLRIEEPLRE